MKVSFKHAVIAVAGLLVIATSALGQDYPNRTVKILVGYPPGGVPDFVARVLGQALSQSLGQQFVVENKPGAGATLATAIVAKSAADGYTLLAGETGQIEIAPYLYKTLPYDTLRDLVPVSLVASTPLIFVSGAKTQIKTIQDVIRVAIADPGKLNYGSSGIGTIHHITMEAFKAEAGVNLTHVPYKGSPLALAGLLGGEVHLMLTSLGVTAAQRSAGTINVIAVSSAARYPFIPDVPSISEEIKGFDFSSETGILAPAGLPASVLAKLSAAIKTALDTPDLHDKFRKIGLLVTWTTPEGYTDKIRHNLKKYERVIRAANIQPD